MSEVLVQDLGLTLAERLRRKFKKNRRPALLLDTSGSMGGSPIIKLREMADKFRSLRRFEFGSLVREVPDNESIGDAGGTTPMAECFELVKQNGITQCVMITDGDPDNKALALKAADGLKIDIIYVGSGEPPEFLEQLAKVTGGKFGAGNLDDLKALTAEVVGLIGPPEESIKL